MDNGSHKPWNTKTRRKEATVIPSSTKQPDSTEILWEKMLQESLFSHGAQAGSDGPKQGRFRGPMLLTLGR